MDTASFTLRFEPTEPLPISNYVTNFHERERFWRSTADINPDQVTRDIDLCESRFLETFAPRLRDAIRSNVRTRTGTFDDRSKPNAPTYQYGFKRLLISIQRHEYGSLETKLGVEGISTIASAFSGRVELFTEFLEQYTPKVFKEALPIDPLGDRPVYVKTLQLDDETKAAFKAVADEHARQLAAQNKIAPSSQQSRAATTASSSTIVHTAANPSTSSPWQNTTPADPSSRSGDQSNLPARGPSPVIGQDSNAKQRLDSARVPEHSPQDISVSLQTETHNAAVQDTPPQDPATDSSAPQALVAANSQPQPQPQIIFVPQPSQSATTIDHGDSSRRTGKLWLAANLSLLFPVLLALKTIAIMFQGRACTRCPSWR